MQTDRIELEPEEIDACYSWHSSMGSMLYAAASTGALSRGTIRPRHETGRPMTDHEWIVSLAERLESEASEAANDARERAAREEPYPEDDIEELLDQADALEALATRCAAFIAAGE
jgi:hypothetical protein